MSIAIPTPAPRTPAGGYAWRQDRSAAALTGRNESERVGAIARSIGQAAVEILAGTRPASQLARWTDPEVVERFTQRAAMLKLVQEQCPERRNLFEVHRAARIRRVRVCSPAPGCYEASLVVEESSRARAMALRIERVSRQWRVTHLEVG
nr:Rv3235 family protein [Kocuria rhizophila]